MGYGPWGHKELDMTEVTAQDTLVFRSLDAKNERGDIKNMVARTSLVVQWLRIFLPMQGTQV